MEKLISEFSVGLFFWQTILFLVLIFLLRKFAWKPILSAISEREQNIEGALKSAEKARKEIEELQSKNQNLLNEARAERDKILKDAKSTKDQIISEAKNQSKVEAERILTAAKNEINTQKQAALTEIKQLVATYSLEIAEKIMRQKLAEDKSQQDLINQYLEEIKLN